VKTIKTIFKVLFASSLLLPFAAQASHPACDWSLDAVAEAINDGAASEFRDSATKPSRKPGANSDTNRLNLLTKLADASVKYHKHAYERASTKLSDISDKATAWENAEDDKKKLVDASAINGAVLEAIDCIDLLVVE